VAELKQASEKIRRRRLCTIGVEEDL